MSEIPTHDEDTNGIDLQQEPKPKWRRPSPAEEPEEIEEIIGAAEHLKIPPEKLIEAYKKAQLEELSDEDWNSMDNCDSNDPSWTVQQVGSHLNEKRDFNRIEKGLKNGESLPAPLVLFRANQVPYLIAGNSRLLGCRALKIRPMVLALRLESNEETIKKAA